MTTNLANILPINVVGTISGTTASGTPTAVFSLANVQHVVIVNETPLEVNLVGSGTESHTKYTDAEAITALEPTTSALVASGVVTNAQVDANRTEFVNASGSLQTQIDAVEGSDVDSINAVTGDVVITGTVTFPIITEGQTITVSGADFLSNLENTYDGTVDSHNYTYTITSDGATITFELDAVEEHTHVQISGSTIFHALPDTVSLTPAGTDTNPQENWIYLLQSGDSLVLTANTSGFPAFPHARVARAIVQTASGVQTNGPLKLHAHTDHYNELDTRGSIGHINAINERIRADFAKWQSGTALTFTEDTGPAPDDITIQVAVGVVYQLHTHDTPALDTSGSDVIYVVNDGTTPYTTIQSLSEITEYSDSSSIGSTDRFNVVIWGTVAENTSDAKFFLNMPSVGYNNDTNAINDSNNTALYSIPAQYAGVGWLIARLTVKKASGGNTWTILQNHDLRGATPSTFPGGVAVGGGGVTDHGNLTGLVDETDHTWASLVDGTRAFTGTVAGITPTADAHLTTKGYVDTDTGALAASGVATDAQVSTNRTEFVNASGSLQSQIDAVEASDVDAVTVSGGPDITGTINFIGDGNTNISTSGNTITFHGDGAAGGSLSNIVEDTTPQLGGNLDAQSNDISNVNEFTAVTGTFTTGLTIGTGSTDIYPDEIRTNFLTASSGITAGNFAGKNVLINGSFDIWQRSTSFSSINIITADRWRAGTSGDAGTVLIDRQAFTVGQTDVPGEPTYYLRWTQTGSPTGRKLVQQRVEDVRTFAGETTVLTFWAKANSSQTWQITGSQVYGSGGSSTTSPTIVSGANPELTTSWQEFTAVLSWPSISGKTIGTNNYINFSINSPASATFTLDIAQLQFELGSIATEFERRPIGTELALCQRYYEEGEMQVDQAVTTAFQIGSYTTFRTKKRAAPSISQTNVANNAAFPATPATARISIMGFMSNRVTIGTGNGEYVETWTADAEL